MVRRPQEASPHAYCSTRGTEEPGGLRAVGELSNLGDKRGERNSTDRGSHTPCFCTPQSQQEVLPHSMPPKRFIGVRLQSQAMRFCRERALVLESGSLRPETFTVNMTWTCLFTSPNLKFFISKVGIIIPYFVFVKITRKNTCSFLKRPMVSHPKCS